jgi:hypothetical protein
MTNSYYIKNKESSTEAYLQGTSIAEGERPGFLAFVLVNGI